VWSRQSSARKGSFTSAWLRFVLEKRFLLSRVPAVGRLGVLTAVPQAPYAAQSRNPGCAKCCHKTGWGPCSGAGLWNEDGSRRRTGCAVPTSSAWKLLSGVAPDVGGVEAEDRSSRRSQWRCSLSQPLRWQRTHQPTSRRRRLRSRVPALTPSRHQSHRQLIQRRPSRVRRPSILLLYRSHLPRRNRRRLRRSPATRMTTRLAAP